MSIAMLITLIEITLARNTISILIAGPSAKKMGSQFKVGSARVAALLDVFSCAIHGILPYSTQLLLAAAMSGVSSFEIIPHLHYQSIIIVVSLISILKTIFISRKRSATSSATT